MYAQLKTGLLHVHVALDCSEICISLKYFKLPRTLLLLDSSFFTNVLCSQPQNLAKLCGTSDKTFTNIHNISRLAFDICSYRLLLVPVSDNIVLLDHTIQLEESAHALFWRRLNFAWDSMEENSFLMYKCTIILLQYINLVVFNHVS